MVRFKFLTKDKIIKLPKSPGVYAFKNGREFLYIGKALNIKERVKNHFHPVKYREAVILPKAKLFNRVKQIGYIKTDSEIEALILEANLIKKYQPKYNVLWKDDKNYFFVAITKEDFPRIFWAHQPIRQAQGKLKLKTINYKLKTDYIGPFVDGSALKKTLKILRKIFPYYAVKKKHPKTLCLACHLKLCPGPNPDKQEYVRNIKNLIAVLKGKRQAILRNLKKEMKIAANSKDFERAAKIRDQVKSLEMVISHARIFEEQKPLPEKWQKTQEILKNLLKIKREIFRIEAYDISNIQGRLATGSMVTFLNGQPNKNYYRKFKIKYANSARSAKASRNANAHMRIEKPNDIGMLKEVLSRRLRHKEWGFPDLILIDGGKAQLNAVIEAKSEKRKAKKIKVISLTKKQNELFVEGQKNPILLKNLPREIFNLILQLRDEAHRFAITYHRKLRKKELIGG